MSRPATVNVNSGNQGWDDRMDDNFHILTTAPLPIFESAAITTLAALETAYPAAAHDRCFIWINLTTYGYTLCVSNGTAWVTFGDKRPIRSTTVNITQLITDKFVRFSGAGSNTYAFLAVSAWPGSTVEIRNDTATALLLDPNASELINGSATSLSLPAGSTARVYNDGTVLYCSVST